MEFPDIHVECTLSLAPRKGQRLTDLEPFFAVMRARHPCFLETPASNGRGENSVRTVKEMVHAVLSLGIEFSNKHPLFLLLGRHCGWILNHAVRNDFLVGLDNRVIKTSPCESHTGNPAPRSTSLSNRILVGRRDDDDKQPRFQKAWFLGLIAGSDEVIAFASRRSAASSWVACESGG